MDVDLYIVLGGGKVKIAVIMAAGQTALLWCGLGVKENSMKETYETPKLIEYGTVEDLTQSGLNGPTDATGLQSTADAF